MIKWIALDIETTPDRDQILQIGAVSWDGQEFERVISWSRLSGEPVALKMNATLISRICAGEGVPLDTAIRDFDAWITSVGAPRPVTFAGKNLGNFFLRRVPGFPAYRHRTIDPAMWCLKPEDETVPSLTTCCERSGISTAGLHNALGDAWMVANLCKRYM